MSGDYSRFTFKPRKRFSGVLMQQGRVQLDADWNEEVEILKRRWEIQATDTFGRAAVPKKTTPNAFKITRDSGTGKIVGVGVGRMYVDGLLAERFATDPLFSNLPFHPEPPPLETNKPAIVYLDVWEREVTYIEDPALLEPALGGPDTATRTQVVWQVKVDEMDSPKCGLDLNARFPPSAGRLSSKAVAAPASDDPCVLPPTGNYRGLENRLYRVEIHAGGALGNAAGDATFKWSRENASIVSQVTGITTGKITVNRIGRDKVLRFQEGDWVEVVDDLLELRGLPGHMAKVKKAEEATLTLELDRDLSAHFPAATLALRHTRVKRWEQKKDETGTDLAEGGPGTLKALKTTPFIELEDGVQVQITADPATGRLKTGDYWVFAARTVDGSVEELPAAPPRGIRHHYAQLASWDGYHLHDCRRLWPDGCCCCTVEVGDGINSHGDFNTIAEAYEAVTSELPDGVPIRICLLPGIHRPEDTLVINRSWVTISGCGTASQVIAPRGRSIFLMGAVDNNIENVRLTSEPDDPQRPALVVLQRYASRIENNLFESSGGPLLESQAGKAHILRNTFVGSPAIQTSGWDLVIAWNEFFGTGESGSLIDLWPGVYRAFILENLFEGGPGHGIALSSTISGPTEGTTLDEIVIAGNDIRFMRGSGIAATTFLDLGSPPASGISGDPGVPPPGTTPVFVHRLRIENNSIAYCAPRTTWDRGDGAPQGGIVLGGIQHLEIADNQINSNGLTPASPVAGIYLGTVRGLIVRDNIVTGNGRQVLGKPVEITEGGIVARDLSESLETLTITHDTLARAINLPPVMRPDGWPTAMVHGNLVVAPRGRALVLRGRGEMRVTDNRLIARELNPVEDGEAIGTVGAVCIQSLDFSYNYFFTAARRIYYPLASNDVVFSDNEVSLDRSFQGSTAWGTTVVLVASTDDLAFQDNRVRCMQGTESLASNTYLTGMSVRATGNGIFESLIDERFCSLNVSHPFLSVVTDNQVTHCICAPGTSFPNFVREDNVQQSCREGNPFFKDEMHDAIAKASRAMFERMAHSARSEATALKAQPIKEADSEPLHKRPSLDLDAKALVAEALAEKLELGLRMSDRAKEIQPNDWSLLGRVLDEEGKPVAGAKLEISEGGKKLSSIPADDKGEFFAHYSGERFKDLFARSPQLTLTIKSADGKILQTLDRPLVPKGDQLETLELRVGQPAAPAAKQAEPAPAAEEAPEAPKEPKPPAKKKAPARKPGKK